MKKWRCPKCECEDVEVTVKTWRRAVVGGSEGNLQTTDDPIKDQSEEWDKTSLMRCGGCQNSGSVESFEYEDGLKKLELIVLRIWGHTGTHIHVCLTDKEAQNRLMTYVHENWDAVWEGTGCVIPEHPSSTTDLIDAYFEKMMEKQHSSGYDTSEHTVDLPDLDLQIDALAKALTDVMQWYGLGDIGSRMSDKGESAEYHRTCNQARKVLADAQL